MPVSRTLAEDLARVLVELYAAAETQLAIDIARRLSEGIDSPDWADRKLTALGTLRRWAEQLLRRLNGAMADEVAQAIVLAYIRGGNAAMQELARLQSTHPEWIRLAGVTSVSPALQETITAQTALTAAALAQVSVALPGVEASQSLAFSLVSKLQGTHLRILRWDLDAYREVVARASQDVLLGTATRRRAAQVAWERLLSRGVTGFVDKSGRNWELASYVEMAVRTTVAQAAVQGHLDRLGAAGLDLVIVSDSPQECIKCRPWEGKVLARVGVGARTLKVPHTTRAGQMVTVEVAGSVAEAIAAGLMHPSCRHSLSAYLPGITRAPTNTEDPEGDRARQHLRYLERQVRSWKLRQEAVIDPAAAKTAGAKVRAYQARIRAHVAATGLIRQPAREQIGAAR
ncbi:minor capsid protein [Micromonospora tulbaghiae]|uniref:Minor capsid protein n=1 Tax=Micromonospora tulbaghiae TaxID=479978 RepID=A0A386WW37_9ACTN|nr:phage minor capsid protein [Micromonospora tulbaghiae]AYF30614.1 minor capsid protein [Micromonospora tulbaghiae]